MEFYNTGDRVFYKFGTDARWHGPGTVIGTDNKVIFLRHGGNVISTSQSRVIKAEMAQSYSKGEEQSEGELEHRIPDQGHEKKSCGDTNNKASNQDEEESDSDVESENGQATESELQLNHENIENMRPETNAKSPVSIPRKGDCIEYKEKESDTWYWATILGRTSKSNVKKNIHYNID